MTEGYRRARWPFFWLARGGYFEPVERELNWVGREGAPISYVAIGISRGDF